MLWSSPNFVIARFFFIPRMCLSKLITHMCELFKLPGRHVPSQWSSASSPCSERATPFTATTTEAQIKDTACTRPLNNRLHTLAWQEDQSEAVVPHCQYDLEEWYRLLESEDLWCNLPLIIWWWEYLESLLSPWKRHIFFESETKNYPTSRASLLVLFSYAW